jgi:hypothetical protein
LPELCKEHNKKTEVGRVSRGQLRARLRVTHYVNVKYCRLVVENINKRARAKRERVRAGILIRTSSQTVGVRPMSTARVTLLAGTRLREKCTERANTAADGPIRGHRP